jgi:hypothetical protein
VDGVKNEDERQVALLSLRLFSELAFTGQSGYQFTDTAIALQIRIQDLRRLQKVSCVDAVWVPDYSLSQRRFGCRA